MPPHSSTITPAESFGLIPQQSNLLADPALLVAFIKHELIRTLFQRQTQHFSDYVDILQNAVPWADQPNPENPDDHTTPLYEALRLATRFLIARKATLRNMEHGVAAAVKQFCEAVELRLADNRSSILSRPMEKLCVQLEVERICLHGYDRTGRVIFIQQQGLANMSQILKTLTLDERIQTTIYKSEYLWRALFPVAAQKFGRCCDQLFCIIDLAGLGFSHMKPAQFQYVNRLAKDDQTIYPERAGKVVLINVPKIFSAVWAAVSPWIDEGLRKKFSMHTDDGRSELLQLVDPSQLPKVYGGTCDCPGGCISGHPMTKQLVAASKTGISNDFKAELNFITR